MIFQKLILLIATVVLVVILLIFAYTLNGSSSQTTWPPVVGQCPDYWVDLSGNGEKCLNTHSLGRCNIPSEGNQATMNFNQSPFTDDNGTCAKFTWANSCQVVWDGITSGVKNPCDTTTSTGTTTA